MNAKVVNKSTPTTEVTAKTKKTSETIVNPVNSGLNKVLWLIAIVIFAVISVGDNYILKLVGNNIIKNLVVFVGFVAAIAVLALTNQGKYTIDFIKESVVEIKKVIWPTWAETNQTSLVVMAVVILISLILWAFDSIIYFVVNFLINLGA